MNASSIVNAQNGNLQKDAATLDIENNDASYTATARKLTLNLTAAVSPDRSDAMSISKAVLNTSGALVDSNKVIRQGGLTRINIPNNSSQDIDQSFYLRNNSTDVLNIREIKVEGGMQAISKSCPIPDSQDYSTCFCWWRSWKSDLWR